MAQVTDVVGFNLTGFQERADHVFRVARHLTAVQAAL